MLFLAIRFVVILSVFYTFCRYTVRSVGESSKSCVPPETKYFAETKWQKIGSPKRSSSFVQTKWTFSKGMPDGHADIHFKDMQHRYGQAAWT
jgi:hypothetical protein